MMKPTFTAYECGYNCELANKHLNDSEGLTMCFVKYLSDTNYHVISAQYWSYFEKNLYSLSNLLVPTLKLYKELDRHFTELINLSDIYEKLAIFTSRNITMLVSADVLLNPNSLAEEDFKIGQARHIHKAIIGILLMEKAFLHLEKTSAFRFDLERSYVTYYLFEVNQSINMNEQHNSNPHALHLYYSI